MSAPQPARRPFLILCATTALLAACLLVYSQTDAFAWDEGFHVLTAQLIKNGKRPYLDFFFPQTPLNAYWNAFWMFIFGDTWRTLHAVAALCTAAASLLTADYIFRRFPIREWRFAGALAALLGTGLNVVVFEYGTVAQAYGLTLLLEIAAFRITILAVAQTNLLYCTAAGLLASAAAASTLLTTVVAPVMLLWILIYNRAGQRLPKFLAFSVGAAIPFVPVLWFYIQRPAQVLFTVFQYNYRYREVGWDGTATAHNIDVLSAWLNNFQAAALGSLALAGIVFTLRRSGWAKVQRAEFYLCAWIAVIMGAHISTAHPTFQRYFLLIVPFLAILSVPGLYWISSRLSHSERPTVAVLAASLLFVLGCAKNVYDSHDSFAWPDFEAIAAKVNQVTPKGAPIWADEYVYFISRRTPPTGMEHENSHKPLNLSPDFLQSLHILPRPELERRVLAGKYYTTATCDDSERMEKLDLPNVYRHSEEIGDCTVYWEPLPLIPSSLYKR